MIFPPFRLDLASEQLRRGDEVISLKPKAFALLRYLLEHSRRLITKRELLERLWGDVHVGDAVLKTLIHEIRQALGDAAESPRFIETAHRRGYRFVGQVQRAIAAPSTPRPDPAPVFSPQEAIRLDVRVAAPFIGRHAEFARCERLLQKAMGGQRQLLFVTGEPGIGKTTLVNTFLGKLRDAGDLWLGSGQCIQQYGAHEPYLPILAALGRLCEGPDAKRIVDVLRRRAPSWLAQLPYLMDSPVQAGRAPPPAPTQARMLREIVDALEVLSHERPLILFLEDLHWADHSTVDLISYLARRSDPARLLVIGACRSLEMIAGNHPLDAVKRDLRVRGCCDELPLGYLTEACIAEYLSARFAGHGFPPLLSRQLHQRTSGNPLFMVSVVDAWVAEGLLRETAGQWYLSGTPGDVTSRVPETVLDIIEMEVASLDTFEVAVLETASVAGVEFSTAAVAAALAEDLVRVEEVCTRWSRWGKFLRYRSNTEWPDGTLTTRFEFNHALYRQVAYDRIGAAGQTRLHQLIGKRLEAGYGAACFSIAAELALHFERGRDYVRAVRYLRIAGEQALSRSAYREAIELFTNGLELLEKSGDDSERRRLELELCIALAGPLAMTKGHSAEEVEKAYLRAKEVCRELGETKQLCPVLAGMGSYYIARGAYRKACEAAEELLDIPEADEYTRLEATLVLGIACSYIGELDKARECLDRVIARYDPKAHHAQTVLYRQDPGVTARVFSGRCLWLLGYPDQGLQRATEAVAVARELADPFAVAFAQVFLGLAHLYRRESEACGKQAKDIIALCHQHGFESLLAYWTIFEGAALVQQGNLERGSACIHEGWAAIRRTAKASFAESLWRGLLSEACGRIGQVQEALAGLGEALTIAHEREEGFWVPELYRLEGELLLSIGAGVERIAHPESLHRRLLSPEACFLESLARARQMNAKSLELRAAMSLARLWEKCGKREQGQELLGKVYSWFAEGFDTPDLQEAQALLAGSGSERSKARIAG